MNKVFGKILIAIGWLMIFLAILLTVLGVCYGVEETRNFYARQDAYYALEPQREEMQNRLDSLQLLKEDAMSSQLADTMSIQMSIDSLVESEEYKDLFGQPKPPLGFSLAGLVTVFAVIIAIPLLAVGLLMVVLTKKKMRS